MSGGLRLLVVGIGRGEQTSALEDAASSGPPWQTHGGRLFCHFLLAVLDGPEPPSLRAPASIGRDRRISPVVGSNAKPHSSNRPIGGPLLAALEISRG
jgi:hypothetical protein